MSDREFSGGGPLDGQPLPESVLDAQFLAVYRLPGGTNVAVPDDQIVQSGSYVRCDHCGDLHWEPAP